VSNHLCKECHTPYTIGALFCDECGRNLLADKNNILDDDVDFYLHAEAPIGPPAAPGALARNIEFVILNSGRRVTLPLAGEIRIGRTDPDRDTNPNLDLSDDDGATLGVSRLHASLQSTENGVILVDLDSTNGTFLHEEGLVAQIPSQLNNGDIFRLGELQVQIFFEM
jgi:pSer/pThr/pTyr-binding forkhead associated (FHA) protein